MARLDTTFCRERVLRLAGRLLLEKFLEIRNPAAAKMGQASVDLFLRPIPPLGALQKGNFLVREPFPNGPGRSAGHQRVRLDRLGNQSTSANDRPISNGHALE